MKRIMILDDSRSARFFIRRCLEVVGFVEAEFVEASNGKEALDMLQAHPVDLVLADFNMPIMDGGIFIKWLKNHPTLKLIPVIYITSSDNEARHEELLKSGALAILGKPLSPATLAPVVEGMI